MNKIILNSNEVPKQYYNINADLPKSLPEFKDSEEGGNLEKLAQIFSKEILKQETSKKRYIKIPKTVRELYQAIGRPTPLFRAKNLEKKLNTPAKIYFKREDTTPTGSHKINSAIPQAHYAKKEGIERLTTETGAGQWGTALSLACTMLKLDCTVYMVKSSFKQKSTRKTLIELYGGTILASPSTKTEYGRKILNKNPEHSGSLGIAISEAIEDALSDEKAYYSLGSLLNHVLLHQTIIGQELKKQLEIVDETPDTMIACVGGGSNFGGSCFPLIKDKLDGKNDCEFIAAEPASCPTLTQGEYRYDYGDTAGLTPKLKMYTLGKDFIPPTLHAGGLRYHGISPQLALLVKEGYIQTRAVLQEEIFQSGKLFAQTEGILAAPESCHAIKIAIDEAKKAKETNTEKTIVFNLSGHGNLDLKGYSDYMAGTLIPNSK